MKSKEVQQRKHTPIQRTPLHETFRGNRLVLAMIAIVTSISAFDAHAAKYRDNKVRFTIGENGTNENYTVVNDQASHAVVPSFKIVKGSYTIQDLSVTKGQDKDNYNKKGLKKTFNHTGELTFKVGRKGKDYNATWFHTQVPAARTTFNHKAKKLNFAFVGTLELTLTGGVLGAAERTFTFNDIGIAQGHTGGRNNWWFGGKHCSHGANGSRVPEHAKRNSVSSIGTDQDNLKATFHFRRGGNGTNVIDVYPTTFVDTKTWMSQLPNSRRLDQIVMPGSHDAGVSAVTHGNCTFTAGFTKEYTITQRAGIGYQLENGSRFFDVRIDYDHGKLVTYHRNGSGIGCGGQKLDALMNEAKKFVETNPSETAIIGFTATRDRGGYHTKVATRAKVEAMLTDYGSVIYSNSNPDLNLAELQLGSVRGKLILVFDYAEHINPGQGRFRLNEDGDRDTDRWKTTVNRKNMSMYNIYSNKSGFKEMKDDQLSDQNSAYSA